MTEHKESEDLIAELVNEALYRSTDREFEEAERLLAVAYMVVTKWYPEDHERKKLILASLGTVFSAQPEDNRLLFLVNEPDKCIDWCLARSTKDRSKPR